MARRWSCCRLSHLDHQPSSAAALPGISEGLPPTAAANSLSSTQLKRLKPTQLRKHAAAAGVQPKEIETAEDGDTPKESLIELVLMASRTVGQTNDVAALAAFR